MSQRNDNNNRYLFSSLMKKARTIHTVNSVNIADIQSLSQKKIEAKPPAAKKQKSEGETKQDLIPVEDIISAWRYDGEPLKEEKIAIDDFIDRTLVKYEDLVRLNTEYSVLLDKYSWVLSHEKECCLALEIVKCNLEMLQVAIDKITEQLVGVKEPEEVNDVNLRKCKDIGTLRCKHTLKGSLHHMVHVMCPFVWNGKQYLASAGDSQDYSRVIELWDLENNKLAATLGKHVSKINAMVFYVEQGTPILASGCCKTIYLWNVSTYKHEKILHNQSYIEALTVYKRGEQNILICGGDKIVLWDVCNFRTIAILKWQLEDYWMSDSKLSVYYHDSKPYLASGGGGKHIKIWSLEDYSLVKPLDHNDYGVNSLSAVIYNGKLVLASGHVGCKTIKLWSLDQYHIIATFEANEGRSSFDVLEYDGKTYLVSRTYSDEIEVFDLQKKTIVAVLKEKSILGAFMFHDRPCIASSDRNKHIKLWM